MARKSKDRTHAKKRAHQQQSAAKTEASRERRLSNKQKRETIQSQLGDVQIVMKDGIPYMNGDKLELINGAYRLVPVIVPEDVHTAAEILQSYEDCHRNTCEHGNAYGSNCSDCDEEELAAYATGEITAVEPEKSRFERLKDKLRVINE